MGASSAFTATPAGLAFCALAALTLGGGAGVAFSRNVLHAAFFLFAALAGVAGLYLFLGADFVGVTQLLVYVGGILVVVLFAVLLTNRIGQVRLSNPSRGRALGGAMAGAAFAGLLALALGGPWPRAEVVMAPTTARLGDAFLREYLLPFELLSFVLLAALIGALVIARRAAAHRRGSAPAVEGRAR